MELTRLLKLIHQQSRFHIYKIDKILTEKGLTRQEYLMGCSSFALFLLASFYFYLYRYRFGLLFSLLLNVLLIICLLAIMHRIER